MKKFLNIFPGDNLFIIVDGLVGVVGVWGVGWELSTEGFSGITTATSLGAFFRALAMTFELAIALFIVSLGEL